MPDSIQSRISIFLSKPEFVVTIEKVTVSPTLGVELSTVFVMLTVSVALATVMVAESLLLLMSGSLLPCVD